MRMIAHYPIARASAGLVIVADRVAEACAQIATRALPKHCSGAIQREPHYLFEDARRNGAVLAATPPPDRRGSPLWNEATGEAVHRA